MTQSLTVTILIDNDTLIDRYYVAEPALSILLEEGSKKILFDTGYSDVFLRNADRMDISLLNLDYVVLSHGHIDHTGGLGYLIQRYTEAMIEVRSFQTPDLIAHPFCFYPRPLSRLPDIGSQISEDRAGLHFHLRFSESRSGLPMIWSS